MAGVLGLRGDRERKGREWRGKAPYPAPGDPLQIMDPKRLRGSLPGTVYKRVVDDDVDDDTKKQDDEDVAKKKARIAAIKAANRAKRKSWNKNVSGTGTVSPLLSEYPSETGTGFSWSSIPAIVWIILAVGGGIFLIKSSGKGRK